MIAWSAESCLKSFVQILIKLGDKVHEEAALHQKEAEEALQKLEWLGSTAGLSDAACHTPNVHNSQASTASSMGNTNPGLLAPSSLGSQGRLPKLTEASVPISPQWMQEMLQLLHTAGHACKFPSRDGYIECNMNSVNKACSHLGLAPLPVPADETSLPVTSITMAVPPMPSTTPPPLPIVAMMGMTAYPVASVGAPSNQYNMLLWKEDLLHDSNDSVSNTIPFFIPHLVWHCTLDDPSSSNCLHVEVLIDKGSPVVLIKNDLASCLQLCFCELPFPCHWCLLQWIYYISHSPHPMGKTEIAQLQ